MTMFFKQAHRLPIEVDARAIAEDAMVAAFTLIASRLEQAGYPVSGDVTPAEATQLDDAFQAFVGLLALNNPTIAELQEEDDMESTITTRTEKAAAAYLATYEGAWGMKASSEDALLSILVALYPAEFPESSGETIEKLRATPALVAATNFLWEELECAGMDETAIAERIVPVIDAAMTP